jgi:hypothetical protein
MALAFILFLLICAMWVGLAALYFVALRREGSDLEPAARLWVWLKIVEYGLLLVLLVSAVSGVPRWALLVMGAAWLVLVFVRSRVKRRVAAWPPASTGPS